MPDASRLPADSVGNDPFSSMTPRFGFFLRRFARRFFSHFGLDDTTVARLRAIEEQGSVVYVMRYASRLDYFLFNAVFVRVGLRLSGHANGDRLILLGLDDKGQSAKEILEVPKQIMLE